MIHYFSMQFTILMFNMIFVFPLFLAQTTSWLQHCEDQIQQASGPGTHPI